MEVTKTAGIVLGCILLQVLALFFLTGHLEPLIGWLIASAIMGACLALWRALDGEWP